MCRVGYHERLRQDKQYSKKSEIEISIVIQIVIYIRCFLLLFQILLFQNTLYLPQSTEFIL